MPLKIGKIQEKTVGGELKQVVKVQKNGFYLAGQDKAGLCSVNK
jgi:hypothetical protein